MNFKFFKKILQNFGAQIKSQMDMVLSGGARALVKEELAYANQVPTIPCGTFLVLAGNLKV